MTQFIGITEGADPTVNLKWVDWVKEGKPAILVTKMPSLLYTLLNGSENIIIHCTITGLGRTEFEPSIDNPILSLNWYRKLCRKFGPERVILRIDPIIPWANYIITPGQLATEAKGRVRISFINLYPHVKERFRREGISTPWDSFHSPLEDRKFIWEDLGRPEVCAEPGLPSTPCVGEEECKILGVQPASTNRGQRQYCPCLSNKLELCTPPPRCSYGCLYCYWKGKV